MTTGFNKYKDKRDAADLAALLGDMWGYHMDTVFKVKKVGSVYRVFFKPTDEFDADWDLICPRMVGLSPREAFFSTFEGKGGN